MKKIITIFLTSLFFVPVFAQTPALPSQCKVSGLHYEKNQVVFFKQHTAKPRLYMIQNISKNTVWLTHDNGGRGMGAGWDSQITSQHWSALLMTKPNFKLSCHVQAKNGRIKKIVCQKAIRVCQFSWLYSKNPVSGGYWVGENLTLPNLMGRIHERGFEV
jgi:hypothetical protein